MLTEDDKFAILRDANVGSVMLFDTVERILASRDARLAAVEALAEVVRRLQEPDPDTGDRVVSFFALIEALDRDDAALRPDPSEAGA